MEIRPQKGKQEQFLSSPADLVIYGGSAGGGKTMGLLLECVRHINKPKFTAVVFRKNSTQVRNPGGLWDSSYSLFINLKGEAKQSTLEWQFPSSAKIKFAHLDRDEDKYSWQGSEIALLCVAKGTKILMSDNSLKPIEDIVINDEVKTLRENQKVKKTFPSRKSKCVKVKTYDSLGRYLSEQIHPVNHPFLTNVGWLSWDDLKRPFSKNYVSKLLDDLHKSYWLTHYKSYDFHAKDVLISSHLEHIQEQSKLFWDNILNEECNVYLKDDQNYFSRFDDEHQEDEQLVELCAPIVPQKQFFHSNEHEQVLINDKIVSVKCFEIRSKILLSLLCCIHSFQELLSLLTLLKSSRVLLDDNNVYTKEIDRFLNAYKFVSENMSLNDVLLFLKIFYKNFYPQLREFLNDFSLLKLEDFQDDYSIYSGLYDELVHFYLKNAQFYLQQLSDVVEQFFPFLKQKDDQDNVQECIRSYRIEYDHPYMNQEEISFEFVEMGSCKITPFEDQIVYDLTIDKANHYITESGLINKNCFDELCHFTWSQFIYMLSRNRSMCGIKPYIRATCNPDSQSWVRSFIDWWIDKDTGYPIEERSGKIRYFIMREDKVIWADTKQELEEKYNNCLPKSATFISSKIYDNPALLKQNPEYLANLQALPKFEREQLLHGNWNIKPQAGLFFKKHYFEVTSVIPKKTQKVRYWDRAATKKTDTNDPDFTVGLKLEKDENGIFYVTDLVRLQETPLGVQTAIRNTATQDGFITKIGIEQDPGQAGVADVDYLIRLLSGFIVKPYKATKDKISRASPVSSQSEAGNIKVLKADWNDEFFKELENFPEGTHDDIVDALSGAFGMFTEEKYDISNLIKF